MTMIFEPYYKDPTADQALRGDRQVTSHFQCVKCHSFGSSVDHNEWPEIKGVRVHVRNITYPETEIDLWGEESVVYRSIRHLCGRARIISK